MNTRKIIIFIIISLSFISCVTDQEEYIPIHITNNTSEDLRVYAGGIIGFSTIVPKNSSSTIIGIKGNTVTITGKDSGITYGHRAFYSEGTWIVN
jgi:hypothetical protein